MLQFDMAILNSLHSKWKNNPHRSKWEYYCKNVNSSYWDAYSVAKPEALPHICTPMPYKARHAITMMRTRSHMLQIEVGRWMKTDKAKRTCAHCHMHAIEDEAHVTLACPAYAHIRADFQPLIQGCDTLERLLSHTTPSPTVLGHYLSRILEHHTLLTERHKGGTLSASPTT